MAKPTPPTSSQLDAWFQTGCATAAAAAPRGPTPLHSFLARIMHLRNQHSALLVLIDDLQWLNLHASGGELEVYDAIVALQNALARADGAGAPAAGAAVATTPSTTAAAFSLPSTTAAAVSASAGLALPSGLLVVTHGDVPVSPTQSLLRRRCTTFLRLSALQTGYTKEITGVLTAQQHHRTTDYWTPMQRAHYKLTDSHVTISAPGHSSSTLRQ